MEVARNSVLEIDCSETINAGKPGYSNSQTSAHRMVCNSSRCNFQWSPTRGGEYHLWVALKSTQNKLLFLGGRPLKVNVISSITNLKAVYVGYGISLWTAGVQSTFLVSFRDYLGSLVSTPLLYNCKLVLEHIPDGSRKATFLLESQQALYSKVDSSIDFVGPVLESLLQSIPGGIPYSIRWSGFVRPPVASVYTMYASVRSWVERVRLWVDNVILIDQWTSLEGTENSGTIYMGTAGGYYDVVM
eukprot:763397-Hanusia_phi.AAC.3